MDVLRELAWLRRGAGRFDPELRRVLLQRYRGLARWPCWLKRPLGAAHAHMVRVPVIVRLQPAPGTSQLLSFCEELRRLGCRRVRHHSVLAGASAWASLAALQHLAQDPRVQRVWLDRPVHALLDVAVPSLGVPRVWEAGLTGRGVAVAVVDTGIHPHPDLTTPRQRIVAFHDVVAGRREPYDDHGHGTHVAGIVAGNGARSGGRYRGVAPDALLVGVKVLDRTGAGRTSDVLAGLDWCLANRSQLGLRVVNLSLGAAPARSWRDDPLALAAGEVWRQGLVVCCAAGNDGPDPSTIASPAIHPSVITVGAADDRATPDPSDDRVAPFSSRGPTPDGDVKPDLVLPGVDITSTVPPLRGLYKLRAGPDGYATFSGTSMATPMASGLAALLLQREPHLGPDQVKARLVAAGRDLGEPPTVQGHGEVDAVRAVLAEQASALRASSGGGPLKTAAPPSPRPAAR